MGPTALRPIRRTKQWLSVLLKDTSWGFEPTLCWTETPEIEFGALNRSAITLPHKAVWMAHWAHGSTSQQTKSAWVRMRKSSFMLREYDLHRWGWTYKPKKDNKITCIWNQAFQCLLHWRKGQEVIWGDLSQDDCNNGLRCVTVLRVGVPVLAET